MASKKNSSVFCRQISTNPELNVNLGFCFFLGSIFLVIFSDLFRNIQSSNCRQNEFNRIYIVSIYNYVNSNFEQTLGYLAQIEQPSPGHLLTML